MSTRVLTLALIPALLIGYMEWGGGNSGFVLDAAVAVFTGPGSLWSNLTHPIIAAALVGLGLVAASVTRATPNRWLTRTTILGLAPMPVLIFAIGAAEMNWRMLISALPFLILATITWRRS